MSQDTNDFFNSLIATEQTQTEPTTPEFRIEDLTDTQRQIYAEIVNLPEIVVAEYPNPHSPGVSTGVFGCFNNETGEVISSNGVGKNYRPPSRESLIAIGMAAGEAFEGVDLHVQAALYGHKYCLSIRPTNEHRYEVAGTDKICPVFHAEMFFAGHGRDIIKLMAYRDRCENMMMFQSLGGYSQKLGHYLQYPKMMEQTRKNCDSLAKDFDNLLINIRLMQEVEIDMRDLVRASFASRKLDSKQSKEALQGIGKRYNNEAKAAGLPEVDKNNLIANAWLAFNAIQGYYQHDFELRKDNANKGDDYFKALNSNTRQEVIDAEKWIATQLPAAEEETEG